MKAELVITLPGQPDWRVPLDRPYAIGRGTANDLVISDARVSRSHALIRPLGRGAFYLLDLGSANGTFLNDRLVTAPVELKNGDVAKVADCSIRFKAASSPAGASPGDAEAEMDTLVNVTTEDLSILVCDIRGFTALSEKLPPKEIPAFIGAWFHDAAAVIERHGGTIDKFIGDAVMAYWVGRGGAGRGALAAGPLASAWDLVELATTYHERLAKAHPGLAFSIGCGTHMGQAVFGNIGQSARRDFTVIGDSVNAAFRLESLCKELGWPVLASGEVKAAAGSGFEFEDLGEHHLKGREAGLRVHAVRRAVAP